MIATIKTSRLKQLIIFLFIFFTFLPYSSSFSSSSPLLTSSSSSPPLTQLPSLNYEVPRGSSIRIKVEDLLSFAHTNGIHLSHSENISKQLSSFEDHGNISPLSPHPSSSTQHALPSDQHQSSVCLVQAIQDDEWMRVGNVLPQVFSCEMNYFEYKHNGNPYKLQETVSFELYKSQSNIYKILTIEVNFKIAKPLEMIFLHKSLENAFLTPLQLVNGHLKYNPENGDICMIEAKFNHNIPIKNLFLFPHNSDSTHQNSHKTSHHHSSELQKKSFLYDCQRFGKLKNQFKMDGSFGLGLRAEIIKNDTSMNGKVEYDYMHLGGKYNNKNPLLIYESSTTETPTITIHSESSLHFPKNIFKLSDDAISADNIIISTNFSRNSDAVYFSLKSDQSKRITSFRLEDLLRNNVLLSSRKPQSGSFENVEIEFKAIDSFHQASKPIIVKVKVIQKSQGHTDVSTKVLVEPQTITNIFSQVLGALANDSTAFFHFHASPPHGVLVYTGPGKRKNKRFTAQELLDGMMNYLHNDPKSLSDEVVAEVRSTHQSYKLVVRIEVLRPVDLSVPMITSHKWIFLEKTSFQLKLKHFDATVSNSELENDQVAFKLVKDLFYGRFVLKKNVFGEGILVDTFTRYHLKNGLIYYESNSRHSEIKHEIVIFDVCSPFSKLHKQFSMEFVVKSMDSNGTNNILRPCGDNSKYQIEVSDYKPVLLTPGMLCYTSTTNPSANPTYHITTFPFVSDSEALKDGGRIVMEKQKLTAAKEDNLKSKDQSHSIIEVESFTQKLINQTSIYFMPSQKSSSQDSHMRALRRETITFRYTVTFNDANIHGHLTFFIPPQNLTHHEFLQIGMTKTLTDNFKALNLPLTQTFKLTTNPRFGVLAKGGHVMKQGQSWSLDQFRNDNVWYQHNSRSCSQDLILFDMGGSFFQLHIFALTKSHIKTIHIGLPKVDEVDANENDSEKQVNNENDNRIRKIDEELEKSVILVQPKYGRLIQKNFASRDEMLYMVGKEMVYGLSQQSSETQADSFVLFSNYSHADDCSFSVTNVTFYLQDSASNSLKLLIKKDLTTNGLENAVLDHQVLQAFDNDEKRERTITYKITQSPVRGKIMKGKSHEKVKSFTDFDLKNKQIHYEVGVLRGRHEVSRVTDSLLIYAMDGTRRSSVEKLNINITMLKSNIKKRSFRHSLKHNQLRNRNKKRFISKQYKVGTNQAMRNYNVERRRNNFGLKVRDINVMRGGRHKFIVTFKKPSKKRRSMSETRLILEKPPSHGKLVVLNKSLPKSLVKSFGEDLQMDGDNFENINLLDISNKVPMIYEHDGSRTHSDNFILTLSNDVKSIKQEVSVKISSKPKVDLKPEQVITSPLLLHGDSPLVVSTDYLSVKDFLMSAEEIEFELVKLPSHGYLKVLNQNIRLASQEQVHLHETFSLAEVMANKIIFVPLSASIQNDSFEVQINADIPPTKIDALSKEFFIEKHSFVLKTPNTSQLCLNKEMIKDIELKSHDLKCSFLSMTKPPVHGRLMETVFSAEDLMQGEVCYKGNSLKSYSDSFELTLKNCEQRTKAVLKVEVIYEDPAAVKVSPKVLVNVPLMVMHGNNALLTQSNLHTTQLNTEPADLIYTISDHPKHGVLFLNNHPSDRFSQSDVDNDRVSYKSNKIDDSMMDYFLFNVADKQSPNSRAKSLFFSILIQPAIKATPKLLTHASNSEITANDDTYWLPFNSSHLKVINAESPSEDVVYHIKVRPKYGRIENVLTGNVVRNRFTQQDLDENNLRFVLREKIRGYNDSIFFKVTEKNKTLFDNQRVAFEWAVMEFQKTFFKLCLSNHIVTIPIVKLGNLDQTTSARITVVPVSAIEHVDFVKMSSDIVTISAGQSKADWVLKTLDRGHSSHKRHLSISLVNATASVIGPKSRAFVEIIDKKDEYCSKRKIRKSSMGMLKPESGYEEDLERFRVESEGGIGDVEDELLESDLSFYNEKQRRWESSTESLNDYSLTIPRPCTPSTKSLLFFHEDLQQMFMCDGRRWMEWNNHLEASAKEKNLAKSQKTCPLGWEMYGDNCFLASKAKHTWVSGEKMCRRDGGHLTFVTSKEHLDWLSILSQASPFWTGLNNRRNAGAWESVGHQEGSNYVPWSPHQPCVVCGRHRCAQVNEALEMEKRHCSRNLSRFVCVKAARLLRTSRKAVRQRNGRYNHRYRMT